MFDLESEKVRDTLDILWSSLATIITCTYTILHLSVPEQRRDRDPGWRGDIKWSPFWRSLKWSLITIVFPEWTLGLSIMDWWEARKLLRHLHESRPETKRTWALTHMLFARMGGFAVEVHAAVEAASNGNLTSNTNIGQSDDEKAQDAEPTRLYHLPATTVTNAILKGLLPCEVCSLDDLLDRSKSTMFTKLLTLGQTIYFLVQFFVRLGEGLPTTPLEIGVLGFVVCAMITYSFVLYKPKDVAVVIKLARFEGALPDEFRLSMGCEREDLSDIGRHVNAVELWSGSGVAVGWTVYIFGAVLGAIHLAGWNLDYPTMTDTWLWRGAALWMAAAVFLVFLPDLVSFPRPARNKEYYISVMLCTYVIARLILIVEMFRCLFYLPSGAFVSTWAQNVPHIG